MMIKTLQMGMGKTEDDVVCDDVDSYHAGTPCTGLHFTC
jgi:hypothetical protein